MLVGRSSSLGDRYRAGSLESSSSCASMQQALVRNASCVLNAHSLYIMYQHTRTVKINTLLLHIHKNYECMFVSVWKWAERLCHLKEHVFVLPCVSACLFVYLQRRGFHRSKKLLLQLLSTIPRCSWLEVYTYCKIMAEKESPCNTQSYIIFDCHCISNSIL